MNTWIGHLQNPTDNLGCPSRAAPLAAASHFKATFVFANPPGFRGAFTAIPLHLLLFSMRHWASLHLRHANVCYGGVLQYRLLFLVRLSSDPGFGTTSCRCLFRSCLKDVFVTDEIVGVQVAKFPPTADLRACLLSPPWTNIQTLRVLQRNHRQLAVWQ